MRCNWWRWLWGIIPLLVLSWVAVQAEQGRIEADLRERAKLALAQAGMSWAATRFEGRDAMLEGQAGDDAEPLRAGDLLRGVWGVRVVENRAELLPKVDDLHLDRSPARQPHPHHGPCPQPGHAQGHSRGGQGQLPGLRGGRPHGDRARRAVRRCVARGRGLRAQAAHRPEARRRPPQGSRHVDRRRGRGCRQLPRRQVGAGQQRAERHQADQRPGDGAGGRAHSRGRRSWPMAGSCSRATCRARPRGRSCWPRPRPASAAWSSSTRCSRATARRKAGPTRRWQACASWRGSQSGSAEMKDAALVVSGVAGDAAAAEAMRAALRTALPATIKFTDQIKAKEPPPPPPPAPEPAAPAAPCRPRAEATRQQGNGCGSADGTEDRIDRSRLQHLPQRHRPRQLHRPPRLTSRRSSIADRQRSRSAGQGLRGQAGRPGHDRPDRLRARQRRARQRQLCDARQAGRGRQDLPRHAHRGRRPRQLRGQRRDQSAALGQARAIRGSLSGARRAWSATQLQPVGYGATRPVAPNDSGENMAKNRRIEFTVRPK